jgi:PTS system ascorbate-specific IIA component
VGIVIVTHGETGSSLIEEAEFILGQSLDRIEFVPFNHSGDHTVAIVNIHAAIEQAECGDGVLILTDLIGSSPSNRVSVLLEHFEAVMVTGVNLPMLVSVWNYRNKPLGLLTRKAVDAGRRGVKIFQK